MSKFPMSRFPKEQLDILYEQVKKVDDVGLITHILQELREYRDLEEQGELILFPKYAYFIKDNKVHKGWVQEVVHSLCRKPLYDIRYDDNTIASYRGYLGDKVFLTKEEAEKALDRLECAE